MKYGLPRAACNTFYNTVPKEESPRAALSAARGLFFHLSISILRYLADCSFEKSIKTIIASSSPKFCCNLRKTVFFNQVVKYYLQKHLYRV